MRYFEIILVLLSHAVAMLPFLSSLRRGKLPNTADFATVSVILYYDLGLVLEMLGYTYNSAYFFVFIDSDRDTFLVGLLFIALAPWLFQAGAALTGTPRRQPQEPTTEMVPGRRRVFYAIAALIALPLAGFSALQLVSGTPLWLVRAQIGPALGPLIILLYLPLHFLAFYVRQKDSRTKWGLIFCIGLAMAAVIATAPVGERTNLLLPFLILAFFRFRVTLARLAAVTAILIVLAAGLLALYKWQYAAAANSLGVDGLVAETISNDIARAPVLRMAIEQSVPSGTQVMPYPMEGYVYSAFFFVPRQIAPFKGDSTAHYFTAYVAGIDPEAIDWGFGVGAIEELVLNGGGLIVIPGLLVYGLLMGLMDRASLRVPSITVATRFAAIWLCGYNLPSIMLQFGAMILTALALHVIFVRVHSPGKVESAQGSTARPLELSETLT